MKRLTLLTYFKVPRVSYDAYDLKFRGLTPKVSTRSPGLASQRSVRYDLQQNISQSRKNVKYD